MKIEKAQKLTSALLEQACNTPGGISLASSIGGVNTEEMLMDGAID